ncbi:MAG TPA: HNH endonuclease signature motif containing protein [Acidimicrobiales bacterium]|nr:HNH endonuclease signature motif containing protein [Acidimicrobiales bacterium]
MCELADGTVITPGQLLPLLTEADIERAVFGPDRRIIDLGRRSRLFVGGARRAVEIRDRRCTAPGCDAPAEECDVDHVPGWAEGGTTDPDHGRLRCPAHHPNRRRRRRPVGHAEPADATPDDPPEPDGDADPGDPGDPPRLTGTGPSESPVPSEATGLDPPG